MYSFLYFTLQFSKHPCILSSSKKSHNLINLFLAFSAQLFVVSWWNPRAPPGQKPPDAAGVSQEIRYVLIWPYSPEELWLPRAQSGDSELMGFIQVPRNSEHKI